MTGLEYDKPASYANFPAAFEADFLCMLARAAEGGFSTIILSHARGAGFVTYGEREDIAGEGRLDTTSVNGLAVAAMRRAGAKVSEFQLVTAPAHAVGRFDLLYLEKTVMFEVSTEPCIAARARMAVNAKIHLRLEPLR